MCNVTLHQSSSERPSSSERGCVEEAAVFPERVQAARKTEARLGAEIALEDLAVIADLLDRLIGPVGTETILLAEIVADAQEALHLGIGRACLDVVDIGGGDAELLGGDERGEGPARDMRPLRIALANDGADRLLRDRLGKNHMLVAVLERKAARGERAAIVRPGIAAPGLIGVPRLVELGERDDLVIELMGAEEIGDIELGRSALGDADRDR